MLDQLPHLLQQRHRAAGEGAVGQPRDTFGDGDREAAHGEDTVARPRRGRGVGDEHDAVLGGLEREQRGLARQMDGIGAQGGGRAG
ncbi:hypothetical protein PW683_01775 [Streptomyces niveus]